MLFPEAGATGVGPSATASAPKNKRTPRQREQIAAVSGLWAVHQGWPAGRWPTESRHDAILIARWVLKLGAPVEFWARAIAAVPTGASFRWLTTGPTVKQVSRVEEWFWHDQASRWNEQKQAELKDDGKSLRSVLARVLAEFRPDGTRYPSVQGIVDVRSREQR